MLSFLFATTKIVIFNVYHWGFRLSSLKVLRQLFIITEMLIYSQKIFSWLRFTPTCLLHSNGTLCYRCSFRIGTYADIHIHIVIVVHRCSTMTTICVITASLISRRLPTISQILHSHAIPYITPRHSKCDLLWCF